MANTRTQAGTASKRPLSPHLQIYRPPINMVMSILHRITGAALYLGSVLLAWWLVAAAIGPGEFKIANEFFGSTLGCLILFGYTWALVHHMLGGIRHFIWDTGRGLDIKTVDLLSWGTIVFSIALTLLIWFGVLVLG